MHYSVQQHLDLCRRVATSKKLKAQLSFHSRLFTLNVSGRAPNGSDPFCCWHDELSARASANRSDRANELESYSATIDFDRVYCVESHDVGDFASPIVGDESRSRAARECRAEYRGMHRAECQITALYYSPRFGAIAVSPKFADFTFASTGALMITYGVRYGALRSRASVLRVQQRHWKEAASATSHRVH